MSLQGNSLRCSACRTICAFGAAAQGFLQCRRFAIEAERRSSCHRASGAQRSGSGYDSSDCRW